ncbi:transposase [Streptomyces sp. NPDC005786]|uniref:transposase n=1 Tax=Streptomyces sp. NPDC005786 TaxID=3154891 RepID=UPI0033F0C825
MPPRYRPADAFPLHPLWTRPSAAPTSTPLARVKRDLQREPPGGIDTEPDDHGLGRSRGGLTTKIHLATEQGQKPLALLITAGHRHDSPQSQPVLARIRIPRTGPGRPRTKPNKVRADKAYGSRANRSYLRRRRIECTIPEKDDQIRNRKKLGPLGGRPPRFDKDDYKERHAVEWDQPAKTAPRCGHAIRQISRALRSNSAGRSHQRVAVTSTFAAGPSHRTVGRGGRRRAGCRPS